MALSRTNRGSAVLSYAFQATTSAATPSFTPAVGSLLVVLYNEITSDITNTLTVTATGGITIGTVTQYASDRVDDTFGSYGRSIIATCQVTAAGSAGTIVINRTSGSQSVGMCAEVIEVNGHDTTTPVRQNVVNDVGAVSTLDLNFSGSPLSTSYLFSTVLEGGGNAPTQPTGWTALAALEISWNAQSAERLSSPGQNNQWSNFNSFMATGAAVEIQEASGQPYAKRLGGVPFAAHNRGVW